MSNATTVFVKDLHYSLYRGDRPQLGIDCRRAIFSGSTSPVLLRGCVVIRVADGGKIMSNCAEWDLQEQRFHIPGLFIYDRDGTPTRGRDVSFDQNLRVIQTHVADSKKGEKKWSQEVMF
jgi:hypothetical protein